MSINSPNIQPDYTQRLALRGVTIDDVEKKHDDFICPITGVVMNDPVNVGGIDYDKEALRKWIIKCIEGNKKIENPKTRVIIKYNSAETFEEQFPTNVGTKNRIKNYVEKIERIRPLIQEDKAQVVSKPLYPLSHSSVPSVDLRLFDPPSKVDNSESSNNVLQEKSQVNKLSGIIKKYPDIKKCLDAQLLQPVDDYRSKSSQKIWQVIAFDFLKAYFADDYFLDGKGKFSIDSFVERLENEGYSLDKLLSDLKKYLPNDRLETLKGLLIDNDLLMDYETLFNRFKKISLSNLISEIGFEAYCKLIDLLLKPSNDKRCTYLWQAVGYTKRDFEKFYCSNGKVNWQVLFELLAKEHNLTTIFNYLWQKEGKIEDLAQIANKITHRPQTIPKNRTNGFPLRYLAEMKEFKNLSHMLQRQSKAGIPIWKAIALLAFPPGKFNEADVVSDRGIFNYHRFLEKLESNGRVGARSYNLDDLLEHLATNEALEDEVNTFVNTYNEILAKIQFTCISTGRNPSQIIKELPIIKEYLSKQFSLNLSQVIREFPSIKEHLAKQLQQNSIGLNRPAQPVWEDISRTFLKNNLSKNAVLDDKGNFSVEAFIGILEFNGYSLNNLLNDLERYSTRDLLYGLNKLLIENKLLDKDLSQAIKYEQGVSLQIKDVEDVSLLNITEINPEAYFELIQLLKQRSKDSRFSYIWEAVGTSVRNYKHLFYNNVEVHWVEFFNTIGNYSNFTLTNIFTYLSDKENKIEEVKRIRNKIIHDFRIAPKNRTNGFPICYLLQIDEQKSLASLLERKSRIGVPIWKAIGMRFSWFKESDFLSNYKFDSHKFFNLLDFKGSVGSRSYNLDDLLEHLVNEGLETEVNAFVIAKNEAVTRFMEENQKYFF